MLGFYALGAAPLGDDGVSASNVNDLTATGIAAGAPSVGSSSVGQDHSLTATGIITAAPSVGSSSAAPDHCVTAPAISIPAAALLPSPSGECLPLTDVAAYLPMGLSHDTVSQRLLIAPTAALPVLMRLAREERQARLRPETSRPNFALLARPEGAVKLWSADLGAGIAMTPQGQQVSANLLASGALFGLAGRVGVAVTNDGRITPGFTLSDARDTPDLLGPLGARSLSLGEPSAVERSGG